MVVTKFRAGARASLRLAATKRLLSRRLRRFGRNEEGSLAIWSLFMLLMMLMIGSLGVDFMANEMRRTQLQGTLDRAVLAAADLDQTLSPQAVVQDYFDKAGLGDKLTNVVPVNGINFRTVSAEAVSVSEPILMQLVGVETLRAPAAGAAEEFIPNTEISLVLDISGSMRWSSRMDNLRPAAREFVATVLQGEAAQATSINIVPYAGQTNPGPAMFEYLEGVRYGGTGANHFPAVASGIERIVVHFDRNSNGTIDRSVMLRDFPAAGHPDFTSNDLDDFLGLVEGYIEDRYGDLENNDDVVGVTIEDGDGDVNFYRVLNNSNGSAPDIGPISMDPDDANRNWTYAEYFAGKLPNVSSCLEIEESDFDSIGLLPSGRPQVTHFMNWDIAADVMDWGWCPQNDTTIVYAQNNVASLHNYIDAIRMHDGTGTHYAMKWALALLDPNTQPAFNHLAGNGTDPGLDLVPDEFANRPSNWEEDGWNKVIVLMTDGQITEQVRPTWQLDPENAEEELQRRPSSDKTRITTASTNVQSFYDQCDLAKANGVTVYTIAFEAPSGAQQEMANCASSPSHYFNVQGLEIGDAFSAIARQINQLRLTQ